MTLPRLIGTVLLVLTFRCHAPAQQTTKPGDFAEPTTGLIFHYPLQMKVLDANTAIEQGHIAVFGSMQNAAKEHGLALQCIHPLLLAELPSAEAEHPESTLLFFEFTVTPECKAGFKYKEDEAVAGGIAQMAIQLPGATALSKPLYLDYGKEKFHISLAAFGLDKSTPWQTPAIIVTAGMHYRDHLFGWLIYARHLETFNQVTKSNMHLADGKDYPVVPFNLNDRLQPPANLLK